jgi:HsdM N-terminal domain
MTKKQKNGSKNGANLGFEQKLWQAADKLRGSMDASDYKHVVLGLIFLKYISDAFQEQYEKLKKEPHADPEDRDEYSGENIFWVPKAARWPNLEAKAKQPAIGKVIDEAMLAIEKENPSLKGVLPKWADLFPVGANAFWFHLLSNLSIARDSITRARYTQAQDGKRAEGRHAAEKLVGHT